MAIPILGQAKIGEDWFLTIPMECPCGQHFLLAGQVGHARPCPNPECRKVYRLNRLPTQDANGEVIWAIGVMVRPEVT